MNEGSVRLLNLFHVNEGGEDRVERMCLESLQQAKAEGQCIDGELMQDSSDPSQFVFHIDFESQDQLEAYLQADWRHDTLAEMPKLVQRGFQRMVLTPMSAQPEA